MSHAPYRAWEIEPLERFAALEPLAQLRHLVDWAVLAPNAHNSQPWHFELEPEARVIRIAVAAAGVTPASDPTGRQSTLSIGCAAETLRAAAEAYGVECALELHPVEPRPGAVLVTARLGQSAAHLAEPGRALLLAIRSRRVNRSKYDSRPVDPQFLREADAAALELKVLVNFIADTPTRMGLAESQYLADRAVIALPGFRRELAELFLTGEGPQKRGMPAVTLGISEAVAIKVKRDLESAGAFNPDWAAGFASTGRDGIRSSPLVVVASVEQDTPQQWLKTGMFFQRCAISAERLGLSVAVHAALVESTGLNVMLRTRLRRLARPTMVFRVGYATQERPHSPRLTGAEVSSGAPAGAGAS